MRPTRAKRLIPLALAVIVMTATACSPATPSSDVGTTAAPTVSASQAAVVSAAPSAAPSASDATASASAAAASLSDAPTASPTPKPTAKPTPKPTPRPTTAPTSYLCAALLTNAEVRKATGLSDAHLVNGSNGRPRVAGQTYCPYTSSSGTITVVLSIWTGGAIKNFNEFWGVISPHASSVSGIGDTAIIAAGDGAGGAKTGKIGISVQIKGPSGVPAGVDALTSITSILKLAVKRV
jgi:hypothetical protein